MAKKHIRYHEGDWFAVPLRDTGYALGIIVRGSYNTKGGLGYFFGPRFRDLPREEDIRKLQPEGAVLITWFGDLGIIQGEWSIIPTTREFRREDWPVPLFRRRATPNKSWVVEYDQDATGLDGIVQETLVYIKDVEELPQDTTFGAGAVEIVLTKLLAETGTNGA